MAMTRQSWLVSFLLLAVAAPASAAVFERDWKVVGDGLLTFDDISNREWLDLTESLRIDLLVTAPDGSRSFDFERDVIARLEPGEIFDGFSVGSFEDSMALAQSAGIDTNTFDFSTNSATAGILIDFLGPTWGDPTASGEDKAYVFGLTSDLVTSSTGGITNNVAEYFYRSAGGIGAGWRSGLGSDVARSNTVGVMLFSTIVPEPSAAILAIACSIMLLVSRQNKH